MTSLNIVEVARKVQDPAMTYCTGPMLIDGSSEYETYNIINTQTAQRAAVGGDPASFNEVNVRFQTDIDPGTRIRFDKSYLKMDYYAANVANPLAPIAIDPVHVSIPWNTAAAIIREADFQLNSDYRSVEKYSSEFGHGNMIQVLTSYTVDALETGHDKFFTPCMEATRDTTIALSAVTQARATRWLSTAGAIVYGSKSIMLSDIFDSMKVQAGWLINRLNILLTFNSATSILIHDAAAVGTNKFFIIGLTLYMAVNKLSAEQVSNDAALIQSQTPLMINAFHRFEATTTPCYATITYEMPSVKNLQAGIAMISSLQCADGVGANPYQYCYGSGIVANTGVTDYVQRYGIYYAPLNIVDISRIDKAYNVNLMTNWRVLNRSINDKEYGSPIAFWPDMAQSAAGTDPNPYVFFTSVFCNQDTAPKKQAAGLTHTVTMHGAATGQQMHVVRVRMSALKINGDLTVEVLE
jgi:hypothetical protein